MTSLTILFLFIIAQEGNPFQRQHVLVIIGHLVVVFLPHVDEVITVNQSDKLRRGSAGVLCIGRECATERMNNDSTQRLSPQGDKGENEVGGLLAASSDFARSVLESIQALAGTTSCKGVQIAKLKDWAIANNCWIDRDIL